MTQWTVQIEPVANGHFQWRHVPVEGNGEVHQGTEQYESAEVARQAGEAALAAHHETEYDARHAGADEVPQVGDAEALAGRSPVSISSLPVEAEVRAADEDGVPLSRH